VAKAFRIVKAKHAAQAFDGEGARRFGGRWNHRGTSVVYTADSLALSALEVLVHLGRAAAKISFVSFEIEIPDAVPIELAPEDRLPKNWREEPPPEEGKTLGTEWASRGFSVALRVPSVIVPSEGNYVLNPAHPDFARLVIAPPSPFSFDPRMWK
jgi:RES domain-containing protein